MRLLVAGAGGQLGRALVQRAGADFTLREVDRAALDITDAGAVHALMEECRPDAVINAAAYTAVDRAESEPEAAQAINAGGARHLAEACRAAGAHLLHVSTDFVFDGEADAPYPPDARTNPLGVYGRSKRDGERAVQDAAPDATIVRTAWVYGPGGHNFVRTMLRLLGERERVSVVADQTGAPTHTRGLADALLAIAAGGLARGRALHWTDAGTASWYDLAGAVRQFAQQRWPERRWGDAEAITTADYPTPARRPRYSVLDCSELWELVGEPPHWRERLAAALLNDPEEWWLSFNDE